MIDGNNFYDNELKDILDILYEKDLHVHRIVGDECLPVPAALLSRSTHYIMLYEKVAWVGNLTSLQTWALNSA